MAKPGFQNKFPVPSLEDRQSENGLHGISVKRRDSNGLEYGRVYYTDDDITINANEFKTWYQNKGGKDLIDDLFTAPLNHPLNWGFNESETTNDKGKQVKQIKFICKTANDLGFNPLNVPITGKATIKTKCLENSKLFTDSGFDHAWKEANKRNLISIQDKEKYLPR
jgi:hypothetical protein